MAIDSDPELKAARREGRGMYTRLRRLCMFIGPDRGGHGLVGSMLDAHPEAAVARAFSVFDQMGADGRLRFADREAMLGEIIKNDRKAAVRGRQSVRIRPNGKAKITPLAIAGQGYRRGERLAVIGTDGAPETARALSANPNALDELEALSQLDVRLIHVVRNPFDNLVSMYYARHHQPVFGIYRWISETIAATERRRTILRVHLEDLAAEPAAGLTRICEFLGLEVSEQYLSACAEIVHPLHESRYERRWAQSRIDDVDEMIASFRWLERYRGTAPEAARRGPQLPKTLRAARGRGEENGFEGLRSFCAFVGHTRSGHSLVGALIDAHPNAIVSHHGKVFGEGRMAGVLALPDREKLFRSLIYRAMAEAMGGRKGQRRTSASGRDRYSYSVAGQWQGRFENLQVLGTQQAEEMSNALDVNTAALDELNNLIGVPVKLINMVRNPWDQVESMGRGVPSDRTAVRKRILDRWLHRSRMIERAKDQGHDVLDVALEELIANPDSELRQICEFLELEPLPDYLDACSALVFDAPNTTHGDHDWTTEEIEAITAAIDEFPWLERYRAVEAPTAAA